MMYEKLYNPYLGKSLFALKNGDMYENSSALHTVLCVCVCVCCTVHCKLTF